jgi:hypothetical protein
MHDPPPDPFAGLPSQRHVPSRAVRLPILLACLLGAVAALLGSHGVLGGGSEGAQASPNWGSCDGTRVPEVRTVTAKQQQSLRGAVLASIAGRAGKLYREGAIGTSNLFSDNSPTLSPASGALVEGGYEVRWWALDAEGRTDDVVVDALQFSDAHEALAALALASSARCHHAGSAETAPFPAGARVLAWVNPDAAYQRDRLFVRGAELYRVSDVPPATGWRTQDAAEHSRAAAVTAVIGCALPSAGCDAGEQRAAALGAGLTALAGTSSTDRWRPGAAAAGAYVQAVSIRPYDFGYSREVAHARGAGLLASGVRVTGACGRRFGIVAAGASPLYIYGFGRARQSVQSITLLLGSDADATRVETAFAAARVNGCAAGTLQAQIRRVNSRHPDVRLSHLTISPLSTATADAYGDIAPEHASADRIAYVVTLAAPGERPAHLSEYEDAMVLAYRRAVVILTIATATRPLPQVNRNYLERVLAGRAVARWGS